MHVSGARGGRAPLLGCGLRPARWLLAYTSGVSPPKATELWWFMEPWNDASKFKWSQRSKEPGWQSPEGSTESGNPRNLKMHIQRWITKWIHTGSDCFPALEKARGRKSDAELGQGAGVAGVGVAGRSGFDLLLPGLSTGGRQGGQTAGGHG